MSALADFDYFSIYGSATGSFGSATLVDYTVTPSMDVSALPHAYYFVTATDFSGNEGNPAMVHTISGVGGSPERFVLSISAYPNPFNPQTAVRYTVPSRSWVEVAVFDATGALIVTLVDEEKDAGAYTRTWNGRDAAGQPVGSGVYFARVSHATGTRSYKVVLLK